MHFNLWMNTTNLFDASYSKLGFAFSDAGYLEFFDGEGVRGKTFGNTINLYAKFISLGISTV